jgi:hypothetical protein
VWSKPTIRRLNWMKYLNSSTFLLLCFSTCAFSSAVVSYSPHGIETTDVAAASIFTFNGMPTNRTLSGQAVSATFAAYNQLYVIGANEYGGASGTTYGVVGDPTGSANVQSATLQFPKPVSYVGFWWSAADPNNVFTLYSGKTAVLTMTNQTLINALGGCGGANKYCGNPNNGQDPSELFAYVNIRGTDGTTFTSAKFQQLNADGGFEFDNVAVAGDPSGDPSSPEPGTWALAGLGALAVSMLIKRTRRA